MFNNLNKRKRRRRRNKSLLDREPENLQQNVKCLGIGSTVLRVNSVYYLENGLQQDDLIANALSSNEFKSRQNNYKYFKVIGVRITVFPNVQVTDKLLYLTMLYGNNSTTTASTIVADDNTKIVPPYGTYPRVFKFKPPNVTFNRLISLPDMSVFYRSYNLREWMECSNANIPQSLFSTYYDSALPLRIQCETIIVFRGSVANNETSKIFEVLGKAKDLVERKTILETMLNSVGLKSKEEILPKGYRKECISNLELIKENQEEEEKIMSEEEEEQEEEDKKLDKKKIVKKKIKNKE